MFHWLFSGVFTFAWSVLALIVGVYIVIWILRNGTGMIKRMGNAARDYMETKVMATEMKWRCRRMEAEILEKEAELSKDTKPKETPSGA